MNKKKIDELIPKAAELLEAGPLVQNGTLPKGYRGQISSFAASVANGSLISAAAFFNQQSGSKFHREILMDYINQLLADYGEKPGSSLYDTIRTAGANRSNEMKEKVLDCAVALKLAMNLFELVKDNSSSGTKQAQ